MFENITMLNEVEMEKVAGGLPIILPRRWDDPGEGEQAVCQKGRSAVFSGVLDDEDEFIPSWKLKYLR